MIGIVPGKTRDRTREMTCGPCKLHHHEAVAGEGSLAPPGKFLCPVASRSARGAKEVATGESHEFPTDKYTDG